MKTFEALAQPVQQLDQCFVGKRPGNAFDLYGLVMPGRHLVLGDVPVSALIGLAARDANQDRPVRQVLGNAIAAGDVKENLPIVGHEDRHVNHEHAFF